MSTDVVPGLDRDVRRAIYDHVFAHDDHEVGGVLIGRLGDAALPLVTASIPALEADGRRASVTFTHEAWAKIHATLDDRYPHDQIVGWYHSHPGFGIFLSTQDRFIHGSFFADPRQIAYVVDPHAGTEGVFHWRGGELVLLSHGPADRPGSGGPAVPSAARALRAQRRSIIGALMAIGVLVLLAVILMLSPGGSAPRGGHLHPRHLRPVKHPGLVHPRGHQPSTRR